MIQAFDLLRLLQTSHVHNLHRTLNSGTQPIYQRVRITYARHTRRLSLIVLLSISMHGCTFSRSRPAAADPRGTDRRIAQHTVNYRTLAYRPTRLNSAVVDLPATQMRRARVLQLPICRANVASYILSKYLQLLSPSTPAG